MNRGNKHTLIVSGGRIDSGFCCAQLERGAYDTVIAVDKGLEFLYENHIAPTDIVGDFDSLGQSVLQHYETCADVRIHRYPSQKDATDTEIAMLLAIEKESRQITVLGATGTRMDHTLANIQLLNLPLEAGIPCELLDPNNRIRLLNGPVELERESCYGTYISLLPLTTCVEEVTLEGFKYPLHKHLLTSRDSLGVSNEIAADKAVITFGKGILIMIEAKD